MGREAKIMRGENEDRRQYEGINSNRIKNLRISLLSLLIILIYSGFHIAAAQASLFHFAGTLHSHSAYSDGNMANDPNYLRAKPCFSYADQSLNIDFWGISDHNHSQAGMLMANYHNGRLEADSLNQPGQFVTMYGMEYGVISSGGHVLVYGIDSLIGWETGNYDLYNPESDYNGLFNLIHSRTGAFAYLAHMSYDDYSNLLGRPYNAIWDSAICGIAVKSGPAFSTDTTYNDPPSGTYFARYKDLLAKGYHLAPGIDHDNHYINFGRSNQGRTIIISDTLTRESLYSALRNRSFYATDDYNARLDFSVNNYRMGSIADGGNNPVIRVKLNDPDNESVYELRIYYGVAGNNVSPVVIASAFNTDSLVYTHITPANTDNYYFTEIIQSDGHRIYSAPVWYKRNGLPSPVVLLNFDGELQNGKANLTWTTSSEQDADKFEVLKSPAGQPPYSIGTVPANGFTNSTSYYNLEDPELLLSPSSYQLKIFNLNGDFSFSNTVHLSPTLIADDLLLFPNPGMVGTEIWAVITSDSLQHLKMDLLNASGQIIESTEFFTAGSMTSLQIPADKLSKGLYLVHITNMETRESFTERLILN